MDEKAFVCRKCLPLLRYFGGTPSIPETSLAKTTFTSVWIPWWGPGISLRVQALKSHCTQMIKYLSTYLLRCLQH